MGGEGWGVAILRSPVSPTLDFLAYFPAGKFFLWKSYFHITVLPFLESCWYCNWTPQSEKSAQGHLLPKDESARERTSQKAKAQTTQICLGPEGRV